MDQDVPDVTLSLSLWLHVVALGGFAGLAGQAIRVVAGLKKVADEAAAQQKTVADEFDTPRLLISLLIGAVAGFLALLTQVDGTGRVSVAMILAVMAAGYAGTDFIEAFAARYLPSARPATEAAGTAGAAPAAAGAAEPTLDEALG